MTDPRDVDLLEQVFLPAAPELAASGEISPSPFHFLFTGEDFLRVTSHNSLTGVAIAIQGRLWDPKLRRTVVFAFRHVPNTDRSSRSDVFAVGLGYLLNVTAFASAGSPSIGQTFIRVQVVRGTNVAFVLGTLMQDYVTGNQDLSFPGSPIRSSIEGGGYYRVVTGTDPAVGSEILETVPTGARWELVIFSASLATNADPTTRLPLLQLKTSGGTRYLAQQGHMNIGASDNRLFAWAPGALGEAPNPFDPRYQPIPPGIKLLAGDTITTATSGSGSGDNWSAPIMHVREWLEAQ